MTIKSLNFKYRVSLLSSILILAVVSPGLGGCKIKLRALESGAANTPAQTDLRSADQPMEITQPTQPLSMTAAALEENSGAGALIPTTFGVPNAAKLNEQVYGIPDQRTRAKLATEEEKFRKTENERETAKAQQSPLDKISQVCPGQDQQVNDALITTESAPRIDKFVALTNTCPNSSMLWLWLAKSYSSAGDKVRAERAVQQSLVIDNMNTEARALLDELRGKSKAPDVSH